MRRPAQAHPAATVVHFIGEGIRHIFTGYDPRSLHRRTLVILSVRSPGASSPSSSARFHRRPQRHAGALDARVGDAAGAPRGASHRGVRALRSARRGLAIERQDTRAHRLRSLRPHPPGSGLSSVLRCDLGCRVELAPTPRLQCRRRGWATASSCQRPSSPFSW